MGKFVATVVLTGWLIFFLVEFAGPGAGETGDTAQAHDDRAPAESAATPPARNDASTHVFDPQGIRHVSGGLYEYDLPADLGIDLFRPLAFQNLLKFTDRGQRLGVYYRLDQMPTQPGYYLIHWAENGVHRVAFSPVGEGDVHEPGRFVLGLDHADDKVVLAEAFVGEDPVELQRQETFFERDTYSGLRFTCTEDTRFSFGANGNNLYSWSAIRETAQRFRPRLLDDELTLEERFDEYVSLLFRNGMLTARSAMTGMPNALQILGVGEGHCGSFAEFMAGVGGLLGARGFSFGAAGDVWGHTLLYQGDADQGFCVDAYFQQTWPIVPGTPAPKSREELFTEANLRWDQLGFSAGNVDSLGDVAGFCTDSSYLIYYGPRRIARDAVLALTLRKGDVFVSDGRVPRPEERRARWDFAEEQSHRGTGLWLREFVDEPDDPTARVFTSDFPIREIWVADDEQGARGGVTLRGAQEHAFDSIVEANAWLTEHSVEFVRSVRLDGTLPPSVGLVVLISSALFPLRANEHVNPAFLDGGQVDYDELRPDEEYVTVARWSGGQPDVVPLTGDMLDALWAAPGPEAAQRLAGSD